MHLLTPLLSLLLFTFFFTSPLRAQEKVKEFSAETTFIFRYGKAPSAMRYTVDEMLRKLAEGGGQRASSTSFGYTLNQDLRFLEGSSRTANRYSVDVSMFLTNFTGNRYRDFPIDDVLTPAAVSFVLVNRNNDDDVELAEVSRLVPDEDGRFLRGLSFETKNPLTSPKLHLTKIEIFYDAISLREFKHKIEVIDEYYIQNQQFNRIEGRLNALDTRDAGDLKASRTELEDIQNTLQSLAHFQNDLNLNKYDPVGFQKRYQSLMARLRQVQKDLDYAQENKHELLYQEGLRYMRENRRSSAERAFNEALRLKPNYPPVLFQFARLAFMDGDFDKTTRLLNRTLRAPGLSTRTRQSAEALYGDLYYYHLRTGDHEVQNLNFEKAIAEYEEARAICQTRTLAHNCATEIDNRIRRAVSNKMEYLIAEAKAEAYGENFIKSHQLLEEAEAYERQMGLQLFDRGMLAEGYTTVFEECLKAAKGALGQSNTQHALSALDVAEKLCNSGKMARDCGQRLSSARQEALEASFREILAQADMQTNSRTFRSAARSIQEAQAFLQRNPSLKGREAQVSNSTQRLMSGLTREIARARQGKDLLAAVQLLLDAQSIKNAMQLKETGNLDAEVKGTLALGEGQARSQLKQKQFATARATAREALRLKDLATPASLHNLQRILGQANAELSAEAIRTKDFEVAVRHAAEGREAARGASNATLLQNAEVQLRKALTSWLYFKIDEGEARLKGQDLASAENVQQRINSTYAEHGLRPEGVEADKLRDFEGRLKKAICGKAQKEYEGQLAQAREAFREKGFLEGDEFLKKALEVASQHGSCGISADLARSMRNDFDVAIDYQDKLRKAERTALEGSIPDGLGMYLAVGQYFKRHDIGRYGITHTPVTEFVLAQRNNDLLHKSSLYLASQDVRDCNTILKELKKRGYAGFEDLARDLGQADARLGVDRKTGLKRYAFADDKEFKKAYTRGHRSAD